MTKVALSFAFLALAAPAVAQDLTFSPEATEACFAAGGLAETCIGASAQACMVENEGGYSTVAMGFCFDREWQYWDAALNAAYGTLRDQRAAIDAENADLGVNVPSSADALRDMQRAWIAYRDRRCDYERSLWGGGTGGGPASIACLMSETAHQALYLEEQLGGE
ncbi:lysozyme inhibitor LprI family protein [Citreimonas sp.]|uniref:lysozyme inhibitor LprI family protein n=1 Tax=Citreimonas sp. TaxID=3036715 RepID=UPI004059E9DF